MDPRNLCCCCLLRPPDRFLKKKYDCLGVTEIFSDMLEKCFQISLTPALYIECAICEVCERRLRDARDFKQQVLRSQAELQLEMLRVKNELITTEKCCDEDDGSFEEDLILTPNLKAPESSEPCPMSAEARAQLAKTCYVRLKRLRTFDQASVITQTEEHDIERKGYKEESAKSSTTTYSEECVTETPLPDVIWPKEFCKEEWLSQNKMNHTGENPFSCEVCNKQFSQKTHLDVHKAIHTGVKPYCCEICSKRFTQKGNLETHKRIHTGEKPYACKICSRKFKQLSQLQTHKRIHTGEKPYVCEICHQQFRQKSNLEVHRRIHTGEWLSSVKYISNRLNIS